MPKFADGLVTAFGLSVSNIGAGQFGPLTSTTLATGASTVESMTLQTYVWLGSTTFTRAVNFSEGPACLAQIGNSTITITNTGSVADVSVAAVKGLSLIGNGSFTATDVSTLLISGPTTISIASSTNSYALKVASGNSYFGGNITSSGTITCNTITANSASFTSSLSFTTPVSITDATNATSTTTGCLKLSGGLGLVKDIYCGGTITCSTLNTSTLGLSSLSLTSLTVSGQSTQAALTLTGTLKLSQRAAITSLPYTLDFNNADAYTIIPVSATGTLTIPSGTDGQLLLLINSGGSQFSVSASIDGVATTYVLPAGAKIFLVWSTMWRSIG